jgi:hypothetical protein|eukprot:COSAG01_NODE_1569_length_9870_cov_27.746699_12_plen_318_part_00
MCTPTWGCSSCVLQTGSALSCTAFGVNCTCYDIDSLPPSWINVATRSGNLLLDHYIANYDRNRDGFLDAEERDNLTAVQLAHLRASGWVDPATVGAGVREAREQPAGLRGAVSAAAPRGARLSLSAYILLAAAIGSCSCLLVAVLIRRCRSCRGGPGTAAGGRWHTAAALGSATTAPGSRCGDEDAPGAFPDGDTVAATGGSDGDLGRQQPSSVAAEQLSTREVRAELERIYRSHNRRKLRDVGGLLEEWAGEELTLLEHVRTKYDGPAARARRRAEQVSLRQMSPSSIHMPEREARRLLAGLPPAAPTRMGRLFIP